MFCCMTIISSVFLFGLSACSTQSDREGQSSILNHPHTAGLTPQVLKYAINGYQWALDHHDVTNSDILTVVNFNLPSYDKRMWVIDLHSRRILMTMHVAQGKNSGAVYATRFSNQPGSLESSPGIYTTGSEYAGEHGKSMRVDGLESGINNNALERAVVIHQASYVTPSFIKENGYAGRSWGCFAVNPSRLDALFSAIKNRSVLFAYAAPENHDPRVAHALSKEGKEVYDDILARNQGAFSQYALKLNHVMKNDLG